jgi:hypothetical protein
MFTIQNDTIQDIDERCNIPMRKRVNRNLSHNHQDLYGDKSHYNDRFNDLGVPGFIVITRENDTISDEYMHTQQDGVISDELFDELFNKIEIKPKHSNKKTKNNRVKKTKDKTKDKTKKRKSK